jgi:hypothetical protein
MIERRWGRIINITGKSEPDRLNAAFSAKVAVDAWAKGLPREVSKYGVTVNSIPPGRIMSEQIRRNYTEEYRKSHAAAEIPVGAYGEPEDLAVLAIFLAARALHQWCRHSGGWRAAALRVLSRRGRTLPLPAIIVHLARRAPPLQLKASEVVVLRGSPDEAWYRAVR